MNKNALIEQYNNEGLTITDFHLGLRLAKPMFINTIMTGFIFLTYLFFFYTLYQMMIANNDDSTALGLIAFVVVFVARYIAKFIAYIYAFASILLIGILLLAPNKEELIGNILMKDSLVLPFVSLFVIALISMIIVYRTNRNVVIKDGVLSIPASDVEQSIIAYIILKPFWGMFYRRNILLEEIISIKNDGYGSKKKDIYPVTVTDVNSSNRLIFTSRQKRDEFRTKISLLLGLRDTSGSSFGESE